MKTMIAITKKWPVLCFVLASVSGFSTAYAQSVDGKIWFIADFRDERSIRAGNGPF